MVLPTASAISVVRSFWASSVGFDMTTAPFEMRRAGCVPLLVAPCMRRCASTSDFRSALVLAIVWRIRDLDVDQPRHVGRGRGPKRRSYHARACGVAPKVTPRDGG